MRFEKPFYVIYACHALYRHASMRKLNPKMFFFLMIAANLTFTAQKKRAKMNLTRFKIRESVICYLNLVYFSYIILPHL